MLVLVKIVVFLTFEASLVCSGGLSLASDVDAALVQTSLEGQFPFLRRTCSKDAVSRFIPLCSSPGGVETIPEIAKVEAAIGLSVCEFENAGLGELIPRECLHSSYRNVMDCLMDKDIRTDWWTTYSGYYQRLGEICHQYSLVFQKEEIIDMFVNLTDMVSQTNNEWTVKHSNNMYEADTTFQEFMDNITVFFSETFDGFVEEAATFREAVVEENEKALGQLGRDHASALQNMDLVNSKMMASLSQVHHAVSSVSNIIESSELIDNVQRLKEVKDEAMEVSARTSETMFQALDVASQQISSFIESMISRMTTAQEDTALAIGEYDSAVRATLNDDLQSNLIEMKDQITSDWQVLSGIILGEMSNWNSEVMDHFDAVDMRLNRTLSTVDSIQGSFSQLASAFNTLLSPLRFACYLLKHMWVPALLYAMHRLGPAVVGLPLFASHGVAILMLILLGHHAALLITS